MILMSVAYFLPPNKYQDLWTFLSFQLFAQGLQKSVGNNCPKLAKKCFQTSWKIALWKSVNKILQYDLFHKSIGTQLRAHPLKISSHSDHIPVKDHVREHVPLKFQVIWTIFAEVREYVLRKFQVTRTTFAEVREYVLWKFQVTRTTFAELTERVLWKLQVTRSTFAEVREYVLWKVQVIQTTFVEVREYVLRKFQVTRTTFAEVNEHVL